MINLSLSLHGALLVLYKNYVIITLKQTNKQTGRARLYSESRAALQHNPNTNYKIKHELHLQLAINLKAGLPNKIK